MKWRPSPIVLILVTAVVAISFTISNASAAVVNHTGFSIQVPNGWVYRENFPFFMNNTMLTPNEFADMLITDNASAMIDSFQSKVIVELAPAVNFPIKNASVELYANYELKKITLPFAHKSENSSIGGERAIKVYTIGTELANGTKIGNMTVSAKPNVTINVNSIVPNSVSYYVVHNDQPYYLQYMSNDIRKYQEYLPQFEQMVRH